MTLEETATRLPLFPLNTVLFPHCQLPLQIFEQRYIRLVRECTRDNSSFVIVLTSESNQAGTAPTLYTIGTCVDITDWSTLDNGLLGINVTARQRVRISQPSACDDGLLTAAIEPVPDTIRQDDLLDEYTDLQDTLKQLESHPFVEHFNIDIDYSNSVDVCNKLSYLLPVSSLDKQVLLEITDCEEHCRKLRHMLLHLQNHGQQP